MQQNSNKIRETQEKTLEKKEPKKSVITSAKDYVRGSVAELKKVHTPTRQETLQSTIITISIMFFFAVVLALLDWIFKNILWRVI